jgi:hypothetical protein
MRECNATIDAVDARIQAAVAEGLFTAGAKTNE